MLIILIIVLLLLFGGGGGYYGYNRWGRGGGAGIGLGTVLLIVLVCYLWGFLIALPWSGLASCLRLPFRCVKCEMKPVRGGMRCSLQRAIFWR